MRDGEGICARIERALGVRVGGMRPLSGSYGLSLEVAKLADGRKVVAKHGRGPRPDHLRIEGRMLQRLAGEIPVPKVHLCEDDLLVMDYIPGSGSLGASGERHMAHLLAAMHGRPRDHFGLKFDTTIGPLPQPNWRRASWAEFFRDNRLMFMARLAHERAGLSASLLARIERLCAHLDEFITEPAHPSLLHGDIWGGNVIAAHGRVAAFIDPAIYHGHYEYDLAFMTMFGTAGAAFFDAYAELMDDFDRQGFFDVRRDVYLIYPHLTHVLICGLSYAAGIDSRLARLGF